MKIVYCTNSISRPGGVQNVTIAKAKALSKIDGNRVWIAVTEYTGDSYLQDDKVNIVNLNINYYDGTQGKNRIFQLIDLLLKQRLHRRKLRQLFNIINPDIVISTGCLEKNIIPTLRARSRILIREIHTQSDCRLFYAKSFYEKIVARIGDFLDYRIFIRRYDQVVLLTEEDKQRCWKNNDKAIVIPNPLCMVPSNVSSLDSRNIVSIGKLSMGKNYAAQIRSWVLVHKRHPDWNLIIVGDGEEKTNLLSLVGSLGLSDCISIIGNVSDVAPFLSGSSIFTFSSLSEGFGLVIIEAMSHGLPVISYDCPCGPKDIITDGKNGYLVPVGDEHLMSERICYLIENEDERKKMGSEALSSVERFSMDTIISRWMNLFTNLLTQKD